MKASTLAALAGLSLAGGTALGQAVNTRLEYQVSHDGLNWSSSTFGLPGDVIQVRVRASYIGPGTAAGVALLLFQPLVSGWDASDTLLTTPGTPGDMGVGPLGGSRSTPPGIVPDAPGVWGRISPFGAASYNTSTYLRGFVGSGSAAGLLRIARADVTNWIGEGPTSGPFAYNNWNGGGGVNIGQIANPSRLSTDPLFNSESQDVVVFKFGFVLGGEAGRDLSIASGDLYPDPHQPRFTPRQSRWFASTTEVSASLAGWFVDAPANVHVVPSPGVLVAFSAVMLTASRRRQARSMSA